MAKFPLKDTFKNNQLIDPKLFSGHKHMTEAVQAASLFQSEVLPNLYVRQPYSRGDYETFRPNEVLPTKFEDQIRACRLMYEKVGVVRNVVDLMVDLICNGLKIQHPDKKTNAFFKVWFKKVKLNDVVQELAKHQIIDCNSVVKRKTAILTKPAEQQWIQANPDVKLAVEPKDYQSREIPIEYVLLNICSLKWLDPELYRMTGKQQLVFKLPTRVVELLRMPRNDEEKKLAALFPKDIVESVKKDANALIKLDMSKISVFHNKKDSWEPWSSPYLIAVLSDVLYKQKLRQAEVSALDGVINVIRLWKLGDHTKDISPSPDAFKRLSDILLSNTGGGSFDILWDSVINLEEFYPPIDKILGSEKYNQVNADILIGLGVPEVLLGGAGANFSNSFIQLKTIVERIENVRLKISEWLEGELDFICETMGFSSVPRVMFNNMNLQDENVLRKLIVGLMDRGVISPETVVNMHGEDFDSEVSRIKENLKSLGLEVTPGPFNAKPLSSTSTNLPGRPGQDPSSPRKSPSSPNKIRTSGKNVDFNAFKVISLFDETIVPAYLEKNKIQNARQLTNEQKEELTILRRSVLASCINNLDHKSINESFVVEIIADISKSAPQYYGDLEIIIKESLKELEQPVSLEDIKKVEVISLLKLQENLKRDKENENDD